jgi:hypothetical protein
VAAAAALEPLLDAALTTPTAPPPIATAAIAATRGLVAFRETLNFRVNIERLLLSMRCS